MDLRLRTLTHEDLEQFIRVDATAFAQHPGEHEEAQIAATAEWPRLYGMFDGDTMCGTAGSYAMELTLPGLVTVPVAGVTSVGVLPTHRRRGILTALMEHQLDQVAADGEPLAILTASEAVIYRRFGYGVASDYLSVSVEADRGAFARPVPEELSVRLLSKAEAVELAPRWFEAHRRARVGEVTRPDTWWPQIFGEHETWRGGGGVFVVACEPADDRPGGYAVYTVDTSGRGGTWVVAVREVIAADPEVTGALWRFLLDLDLVGTVTARVPVDQELRWRLVDRRGLQVTGGEDFLWVRVVDPVAVLSARRYPVEGELVVAIADRFHPSTEGRYRVRGGPDGAEAARTDALPDLRMDVAELGSLVLGGTSAVALGRAGRIESDSPDLLHRADRFLATAGPPPFCSTMF